MKKIQVGVGVASDINTMPLQTSLGGCESRSGFFHPSVTLPVCFHDHWCFDAQMDCKTFVKTHQKESPHLLIHEGTLASPVQEART